MEQRRHVVGRFEVAGGQTARFLWRARRGLGLLSLNARLPGGAAGSAAGGGLRGFELPQLSDVVNAQLHGPHSRGERGEDHLEEAAYERALLGVVRRVRDELELPERRVDARGADSVLAPNDAAHWVTM